MATDTEQSYSLIIRDVFFDTLKADPFFEKWTKRKTPMLQIQPEHLPYLGIYLGDETMVPDGQGNHGMIGFMHSARISFSVMISRNDDAEGERVVDRVFWHIMDRLFCDQYVMNMLDTFNPHTGMQNPGNTRVESIERGQRRTVFGVTGLNNETPTVELQYQMQVNTRTYFEPVITDDLLEINVRTGIKIGETEEEMAQRKQVGLDLVLEGAASKRKERQHG
jgi:hypothetical protein